MNEEDFEKIVRFLNDPEDVDKAREIDRMRSQSPEHEMFFQEVQWLWETSAELQTLDAWDVTAEAKRFTDRLQSVPSKATKRRTQKIRLIAACLTLTMLAAGAYLWTASRNAVKWMTVNTGTNVQDTVHLSDGTVIYLDENTSIEFPQLFHGDKRLVHLKKGRAFFAVKHDKAQPFLVALPESSVTVLGTSFTISTSRHEVCISVKTGSVGFNSTSKSYTSVIQAGNGVTYNHLTRELQLFDASNRNDDAWLTNELVFADASLEDVLTTVARYYKVNIQITSSISAFRKFNATFRNNDLRTVMDVLEATYPVQFRQESFTSYTLLLTNKSK